MIAVHGVERIAAAFARAQAERRLAIILGITVGFPDRASFGTLLRAALDGGADLIELVVPFSDPLADGATVQRASETALRQGITLDDAVEEGAALVAERGATVLLMGYTNPFLRRGYARLAADLERAGIAGLIVPDMPAEESAELDAELEPRGLARVDLYAPTTPDTRLERLVPSARGFVYCVSLTGVTGARATLSADAATLVTRVRRHTSLPIAVGFGIAGPEQVRALRGVADGVVVASAALDTISRAAPGERAEALTSFVRSLREAGR